MLNTVHAVVGHLAPNERGCGYPERVGSTQRVESRQALLHLVRMSPTADRVMCVPPATLLSMIDVDDGPPAPAARLVVG